jgi:hypothetical protein
MAIALITSQTLASTASSVTLSAIPQTYTDLILVISGRDASNGGTSANPGIKFNNDAGSNMSQRRLYGDGGGASSTTSTAQNAIYDWFVSGSTATANTFGNATIYIPNYAGATAKSFSMDAVSEHNATTAYQEILAGLWNQTAAITTINLLASNTWAIGSSFTLYGISKSGATGATVA